MKRGVSAAENTYYGDAAPAAESGAEAEDELTDQDEDEDDHDISGALIADGEDGPAMANACDLLWQGTVARRTFHGFRFQVIVFALKLLCYLFFRSVAQHPLQGRSLRLREWLTTGTWL